MATEIVDDVVEAFEEEEEVESLEWALLACLCWSMAAATGRSYCWAHWSL